MAGSFCAEIHCIMEHTVYGVTRPLGTVVDCQTFMTAQNLHSLYALGITIHAPSLIHCLQYCVKLRSHRTTKLSSFGGGVNWTLGDSRTAELRVPSPGLPVQNVSNRSWISVLALSAGWLGSRVVSVLDSGAEGPEFKSQPQRCRVTVL